MINGPIEEDLWEGLSRIEIRDNKAFGQSLMVNYHTNFKTLDYLRKWQREMIEMEQKARMNNLADLRRINSADSGIGLSSDDESNA